MKKSDFEEIVFSLFEKDVWYYELVVEERFNVFEKSKQMSAYAKENFFQKKDLITGNWYCLK